MSTFLSRLERRRSDLIAAAIVALAAILPLARVLLAGESLYFRDLGRYYFPLRRFVIEGLLSGELRYWNPLVYEGVPELFPPVSYPFDLLQLLLPDERGFTLTLALHLPLAALGFFVMARVLALPTVAAATGAAAYALGGFALSTLNLYEYVQVLAWAPWLAAALVRAVERGGRSLVPAALCTAILLSTGRVEAAAQALIVAGLLALPGTSGARWLRLASAVALGSLLAAPTLLTMRGAMAGSPRGVGLAPAVVLGRSIHPFTYLQTVVADLHGDVANLVGRFWGDNFFEAGTFPYFLSFYLGPVLLVLALLGLRSRQRWVLPLAVLAAAAVWLSLGRWGGLQGFVAALPPGLRSFRYPCKAFFTVHLASCLFAAAGVAWLTHGDARRWRTATILLALVGLVLTAALLLPSLGTPSLKPLLDFALPQRYPPEARLAVLRLVVADAARGGALVLLAALVAFAAARRRLSAVAAAALLACVVAADLLRAGAGLNPSVNPSFLSPSPETRDELARLRAGGGRVLSCSVPDSRAWLAARPAQSDSLDVWTLAAMRDALTPYFGVSAGVSTAFGDNLTALVPVERAAVAGVTSCPPSPAFLETLRRSGVAHVVSLDPLPMPQLSARGESRPRAIAPLVVHSYDLVDPAPMRSVSGGRVLADEETSQRLRLRVFAERPSAVFIRDAWAPGWHATVAGREVPVLRADDGHRLVSIPAGTSDVLLEYRPPGLRVGLLLAALAVLALLVVGGRGSQRARSAAGDTAA